MLYVLVESVMNGTVTIGVHVSAIEADTFAEAVDIVKTLWLKNNPEEVFDYCEEDNNRFVYGHNNVVGLMNDAELKIFGKKDAE